MAVQPPDVAPGWYPDPDQANTQRYWDGSEWTDQRAPLVERPSGSGAISPGLIIAWLGAVVAIVGVFLPQVTAGSLPSAAKGDTVITGPGNSLISHWEGVVIIALALGTFLVSWRPPGAARYTRVAGALIVAIVVWAATHFQVHFDTPGGLRVSKSASPGLGIWVAGVGGLLLGISQLGGRIQGER